MDSYELHGRVGQFHVPDHWIKENIEELMLIMSKIIVIRCEHIYNNGFFSYTALSPLFDKAEDGYLPPYYSMVVIDGEVRAKQMFTPRARGKIIF